MPAAFDIEAAKKAGYSEDEILSHLTTSRKFDIAGALGHGYTKPDIIAHLSGTAATTEATAQGPHGFWDSVRTALSGYNPVEALKEWWKTPEKFSALTDALAIERQIKKDGRSEPNADERAKLDSLHARMGAPGDYAQAPVGTEPALKAVQQGAPESMGGQGDPGGSMGTMVGSYGPALAAPAIVKGAKAAKAAVPAVARVASTVAGSVPPDLVGVVSPRAAHILGIIQRLKKGIAPATDSVGPVSQAAKPQIVPGEAPPPERPSWRQDVVSELNPEPVAQPSGEAPMPASPAPVTQPEPAYVPPVLKDNPMAMDASVKLRDVLGGKTEPPSVIEKKPKASEPAVAREAVNRDKRASAIAEFLHAGGEGMDLESAAQLDPLKSKLDPHAIDKLWKQIDDAAAQQYGLKVNAKPPSMATQRQVLEHLQRLWAPALSKNPAAFSAAQKLQEAMGSNVVPIR